MNLRIFFVINFTKKHLCRSYPQATVPVKLSIYHKFFTCFRMFRNIFHQVVIAFEMAIDSFNLKPIHLPNLYKYHASQKRRATPLFPTNCIHRTVRKSYINFPFFVYFIS